MVVVSTHRRGFAPPVWRMLQVLTTQIDSWLDNLDTEVPPRVLRVEGSTLWWSSLWPDRPLDRLRIDVEAEGSRSVLGWSLNRLLNGQLRDHLDNRG